jgi:hypothetical protein
MNVIDSIEIQAGKYTAEIEVCYDEDPMSPNEWGGYQVFSAQRGSDLDRKLESEFGEKAAKAAQVLADGGVFNLTGYIYLGIEEYRHSGSAFALCAKRGDFPDRRWDVIPFAGWVRLDADSLSEKERKGERLLRIAKGVLQEWQDYVNGECYCWSVEVTHAKEDGYAKSVASDSCSGYIGDLDYVKEDALSGAVHQLADFVEGFEVKKWEDYK